MKRGKGESALRPHPLSAPPPSPLVLSRPVKAIVSKGPICCTPMDQLRSIAQENLISRGGLTSANAQDLIEQVNNLLTSINTYYSRILGRPHRAGVWGGRERGRERGQRRGADEGQTRVRTEG